MTPRRAATSLRRALLGALALSACPARPQPRPPAPADAPAAPTRPAPDYGPPTPQRALPRLRIPPGEDTPCTRDEDCRGGMCFTATLEAQYSRVFRDCPEGQAWRAQRRLNTCVRPACRSDADCPTQERCADIQMLPFPQRVCVPAGCRSAADCRARRLGQCLAYVAGTRCEHGGWACAYPGDPCAPQNLERRCTASPGRIAYCVPREGRFRCVEEEPPPP
jgi:hypothetical protein